MRITYVISLLAISLHSSGQESGTGKVLVANDYRDANSSAIAVKWFDKQVYYEDGFNVYRKEEGSANWIRLNDTPVNLSEADQTDTIADNKNAGAFLQLIRETKYKEFQESIMPAFVAIYAIIDPAFAEQVGILLYDEKAEAGRQYQYRVMSIDKKKENLVGISPAIISGAFVQEQPPQGIQVQRRSGMIDINWIPEVTRYYGVHVYRRSEEESAYGKITDLPYALQRVKNEQGELKYPEIFFTDTTAVDSMAYDYKLSTLDFFGQESPLSQALNAPSVDFEAPLPPLNLQAKADTLDVTLTWEIQKSKDLAGFNVYRFGSPQDEPQLLTTTPIGKRTNTYTDRLNMPGSYYYSIAAVDESGNENHSTLIIEVRDIVAPASPKGLQVVSDTGRVVLTWDANEETDISGYVIYRSLADENNEDNSFVIVTREPVVTTRYVDQLPKNARNEFVYAVGAVDTSFNYSDRSGIATATLPDVTAPLAPVITNVREVEGGLSISWIGSVADDVKGYQLFRVDETTPDEVLRLSDEWIAPGQTTFLDAGVVRTVSYSYYLVAVDQAGNESDQSNTYSRRFGSSKNELSAITDLQVNFATESRQVRLNWQSSENEKLKGFIIYRGVAGKALRPITGFETTSGFIDSDLPKEENITYQVKAYGANGLLASSEKKTIQITPEDN
ncbi:MAG: hypothetical protein ABJG78_02395 [Cyclobacteriaceae bacterium]